MGRRGAVSFLGIFFSIFGTVSLQCGKTPAHFTCLPSARVRAKEARKNYKMGQKAWGSEPTQGRSACMYDCMYVTIIVTLDTS
jgi:hypothetical protein